MSVAELRMEDSYGRMIVIGKFAGQITIRPIAGKIGDALALDRHQAHLLLLYLQEHVPPPEELLAMTDFAIGDVVVLNSGGPAMTIVESTAPEISVCWFVDGIEHNSHFPAECLIAQEAMFSRQADLTGNMPAPSPRDPIVTCAQAVPRFAAHWPF